MIVCGSRAHLQDEAVAEVKVSSEQTPHVSLIGHSKLKRKNVPYFYSFTLFTNIKNSIKRVINVIL